jgi:prepilin-type N-terminal cleavage/methylation domain-containing protein
MNINIGKALNNRKGFTLIELIMVIIVLGIILGIGIPKYTIVQSQTEWDADLAVLKSMEKAAEVWVALYHDRPVADAVVTIDELDADELFDKKTMLTRLRKTPGTKSERNPTFLDEVQSKIGVTPAVTINPSTGYAEWKDNDPSFGGDGVNDWINKIIGLKPPAGS